MSMQRSYTFNKNKKSQYCLMAAVESKRKWRSILILLILEQYMTVISAVTSNTVLERVNRQQSNDIYYFSNSSRFTCDEIHT